MIKIILLSVLAGLIGCVAPNLNRNAGQCEFKPKSTPNPPTVVRHFLYVADTTAPVGAITRYQINDNTGELTNKGQTNGSFSNYSITVSSDGKYLFATGSASEVVGARTENFTRVSSFSIDQSTGDLKMINTIKLTTGTVNANPTQITIHPSNKFVYVTDGRYQPAGGIFILSVSPQGILSYVSTVNAGGLNYPHGISFSPDGKFAIAANFAGYDSSTGTDRAGFGTGDTISAFVFNQQTGELNWLTGTGRYGAFEGGSANAKDPRFSIFDPNKNIIYVMDANGTPPRLSSWKYDTTTGVPTVQGSVSSTNASGNGGWGVAQTVDGKFIFTAVRNATTVSSYYVSPSSDVPSFTGDITTSGTRPCSISIHPAARYVYVSHQNSPHINVFAYDPVTGSLSPAITPTYFLPLAPGSAGARGQSTTLATTLGY
jgi:6-phosphogluconolactonase (cycloisomerase 2 family)